MPLYSTDSVFMQTVVAFLLASCAILTSPGEIARGPYLQLSHSTGITVVWRTSEALADPTVKYWTDENVDSPAVTRKILVREAMGPNALSKVPEGQVQYEAILSELRPDTTYHYAICDGEKVLTPKAVSYTHLTLPTKRIV